MNWLAHVYLSRPDVEHRLGNLLTDTFKPHELEGYGENFTAGVKCHYEIDRFTDSHELVKQSKARLFKKYRHFAAVLVDVYYDHLLAVNWERFSVIPCRDFLDSFYRDSQDCRIIFKAEAQSFIDSVTENDRLGLYDSVNGVSGAFERISSRRKNPSIIDISVAAEDLVENFSEFESDFLQFFPLLQNHIKKFNKNYEFIK